MTRHAAESAEYRPPASYRAAAASLRLPVRATAGGGRCRRCSRPEPGPDSHSDTESDSARDGRTRRPAAAAAASLSSAASRRARRPRTRMPGPLARLRVSGNFRRRRSQVQASVQVSEVLRVYLDPSPANILPGVDDDSHGGKPGSDAGDSDSENSRIGLLIRKKIL